MIWGGIEVVLALGIDCKYRLSLAERSHCTETMINQLLADSYQNPISEWQVTINRIMWQALQWQMSWYASVVQLHLALGFKSESDTYFSLCVAHSVFYLPLGLVTLNGIYILLTTNKFISLAWTSPWTCKLLPGNPDWLFGTFTWMSDKFCKL